MDHKTGSLGLDVPQDKQEAEGTPQEQAALKGAQSSRGSLGLDGPQDKQEAEGTPQEPA